MYTEMRWFYNQRTEHSAPILVSIILGIFAIRTVIRYSHRVSISYISICIRWSTLYCIELPPFQVTHEQAYKTYRVCHTHTYTHSQYWQTWAVAGYENGKLCAATTIRSRYNHQTYCSVTRTIGINMLQIIFSNTCDPPLCCMCGWHENLT